jgi:polyphosphate kinase
MAFINREISWLKFNERVLDQATLIHTPFFEKLRFIDIAGRNADEFYMVRVGSLQELSGVIESNDNKTNLSISQQLKLISKHYKDFVQNKDEVFVKWLADAKQHKIYLKTLKELKNNDVQYLETYYKSQIEPLLSPMVVGPSHPFPFIQNNQSVIVVLLKKGKKKTLGLIPLDARIFPLVLTCPSSSSLTMVYTSSIIQSHVARIFKGMTLKQAVWLKLIRNADLDFESSFDEELSMKDVMKKLLKRRQRLAPVRLDLQVDHPGIA